MGAEDELRGSGVFQPPPGPPRGIPPMNQPSLYSPPQMSQMSQMMRPPTPPYSQQYGETGMDPEDEPPLLEELGIDPERIREKTLAVLNPFHELGKTDNAAYLLSDADLAGPVLFCVLLGATLVLSGGRAPFGYIYGLAVISCIAMYLLLSLMTIESVFTFTSVASVLGYCLLPVVGLSFVGIFVRLSGLFGLIFGLIAVLWCALSASRLFVAMSQDKSQQSLIAYPCALLYGVFALIVIF